MEAAHKMLIQAYRKLGDEAKAREQEPKFEEFINQPFLQSDLKLLLETPQVMSQSVITPTGSIVAMLSTIGISPQSLSTIFLAAMLKHGVGRAGSGVITSFASMVLLPG